MRYNTKFWPGFLFLKDKKISNIALGTRELSSDDGIIDISALPSNDI